ncbi:MAG: hypothetical protein ACI9QL_001164 [Candidatus Omnitrophota bacterium]|jgi:hypothetical protein
MLSSGSEKNIHGFADPFVKYVPFLVRAFFDVAHLYPGENGRPEIEGVREVVHEQGVLGADVAAGPAVATIVAGRLGHS